MEPDWVIVYSSNNLFESEMLVRMLADNDIEAIIINKQDSSYPVFGNVEMYVKTDKIIWAKKLITDFGK
jgi:hypothetical protein